MNELCAQIRVLMEDDRHQGTALKQALGLVLANFCSETGTIHLLDPQERVLHLAAEIGLPPALLDVVRLIPVGKGIAGQTVARGGPVSICNLQKDKSGVARPGARQTGVGGALCVPLRHGEVIVGTIGIGTLREYEFTPEETRALEKVGRVIGGYLRNTGLSL
jgi:L-methionine (R)-S-oxide reductase